MITIEQAEKKAKEFWCNNHRDRKLPLKDRNKALPVFWLGKAEAYIEIFNLNRDKVFDHSFSFNKKRCPCFTPKKNYI